MKDPFSGKAKLNLRAFDGREYVLYRSTWDLKLAHPERAHIQYNFIKIMETLKEPDEVRESEVISSCFLAYKKYTFYWVRPGISAPNPPGIDCFAVVADRESRVVK